MNEQEPCVRSLLTQELLSTEPDYSDLDLKDSAVSIIITKNEKAAVLAAYDRGLYSLNEERQQLIDAVLAKLKDQIWM